MSTLHKLFLLLLLSTVNSGEANKDVTQQTRETRATSKTSVVNLDFCSSDLPAKDKVGKKTLEEVHTYAELKHDPCASLPHSFTVCSTIMATDCVFHRWSIFFNILNNNSGHILRHVDCSNPSKCGNHHLALRKNCKWNTYFLYSKYTKNEALKISS